MRGGAFCGAVLTNVNTAQYAFIGFSTGTSPCYLMIFGLLLRFALISPRKNVYCIFVFIHDRVLGLLVDLFIFSCVPLVTTFCSSCRSTRP